MAKTTVSSKSQKISEVQRPESTVLLAENGNIVEYLQQHKSSDTYVLKYKAFASAFLSTEMKDSMLVTWLKQFKDNILFLERENEEITDCLLRLDWVHKSPKVVSSYQELMLHVVSAHPYYLRRVLEMLIKLFSTGDDGKDYPTDKEKELFSKGHHLLQGIINLIPMSPTLICNVLLKNYPYAKRDIHVHACYVQNVFKMCSYLPSHRLTILEGLVMQLLRLDVLCLRHQIQMDEMENSDDLDEKTFSMDHDGVDVTRDVDCMADPLANTLDILMDSVFEYVKSVCLKEGSKGLNWDATKKLFKEFLTLFDKVVLSTYGSNHVQFILFYLCSLKVDLQEAFIDYLWKKVQNPNTAPTLRQAATFYIGSYLARASYVTISTVADCFDLMCLWIHQYIDSQCYHNYDDISVHGTFYSVCQAVFYVFAFRHRELIGMKKGLKFLRNLNFERIISCKLNPLKVCLPAIVQNFASVTRNYQLAYCYTIIERNNRNLMSHVVQSPVGGSAESMKLLHTLFPFDPYLLKRSKKWIDPIYRVYEHEGSEPMDDQEEDFMLNDQHSPSPRKPSFTDYGSSMSSRPLFSSPKS